MVKTALVPRAVSARDCTADLDPNYLADPHDWAMSLKSVRIIRDVLARPAIAALIESERLPGAAATTDEGIMAYVRQYACCDYHPAGTCRMGVDKMAVVNPELRVRGISNLHVIDSSIMPGPDQRQHQRSINDVAEKRADLVRGIRNIQLPVSLAAE